MKNSILSRINTLRNAPASSTANTVMMSYSGELDLSNNLSFTKKYDKRNSKREAENLVNIATLMSDRRQSKTSREKTTLEPTTSITQTISKTKKKQQLLEDGGAYYNAITNNTGSNGSLYRQLSYEGSNHGNRNNYQKL